MDIDVEFNIVTIEHQSTTGGEDFIDYHLNLDVFELDGQGKYWITSAVITRKEMLDFLGLNET